MVITLVLQGVEGVVEVVRLRKSWIGEEMLSEASLDDDEIDLVVLLKQQVFTLILVVLAHDFDDSDEVLDLVISNVLVLMFERRRFDVDGVI
jgi:hypothetical protein